MTRTLLLGLTLLVTACSEPVYVSSVGGAAVVYDPNNQNAPPPEPVPVEPQTSWANRMGSGRSAEDPVSACGPADSYAFVAREFQCPGGGNPLGGDPAAGQHARTGNVGANSSGHIIDLYVVPCPTGDVEVFVDMYGCPEMDSAGGEAL